MRLESPMLTCRELTGFIADYLAGDLSPDVRSAFEEHLRVCSNCLNYLDGYKAAIELGRGAFAAGEGELPSEVPDDLVQAILRARKP